MKGNPELLLFIMSHLESAQEENRNIRDLVSAGIQNKLFYDKRTFEREMQKLKNAIPLTKINNNYCLPEKKDYLEFLTTVIQNVFSKNIKISQRLYQIPGSKPLLNSLANTTRPASLLHTIAFALENSIIMRIVYEPQEAQTLAKVLKSALLFGSGPRNGKIHADVIPHYLVSAENQILLLAETKIHDEITERHYSLQGFLQYELKQTAPRKLLIQPHLRYQHSRDIWVGGKIYQIKLAKINPITDEIQNIHTITVNGENEILKEIIASFGKLKIIDPPEEIVNLAVEKEFPLTKIFIFGEKK